MLAECNLQLRKKKKPKKIAIRLTRSTGSFSDGGFKGAWFNFKVLINRY